MAKNKTTNYPLELLISAKMAVEVNIKGVPGMYVDSDMIPVYSRQLQQLKKAIEYLEMHEKIEKRKRARKQKVTNPLPHINQ
jgi:hypothetical protein